MKIRCLTFMFILVMLIPFTIKAESITLYAYPPKNELKWETSPRKTLSIFLGGELAKLVSSGAKIDTTDTWGEENQINEFYKSSMGHTIAHIKCTNSENRLYDSWVSFSGQNFLAVDKKNIFKDKIGLGVLFYDYVDGHIISGEENIKRLIYHKGGKRDGKRVHPRYLQYKINTEACDNVIEMVEFYKTFHYNKETTIEELMKLPDEKKLYFTVNLDPYESFINRKNDPHSKVGGGCAPFGVGLLKAAGLFDSYFDSIWKLNVDVSHKLIGNENDPVKVSSLLVGSLGKSWTYEGYDNRRMSVYDPDKIWTFIGKVNECIKSKNSPCDSTYKDWIQTNRNHLHSGKPIRFSDTRDVLTRRQYEGQVVEETSKQTRTVTIEGVRFE